MSDLMKVSSNPHIRSKDSTGRIMLAVIAALLPTTIFGIWNFGIRALLIVAVTIASTVLTEFLYEKITKKKNTIGDLSAVVTGLLLALNLPVSVPFLIRYRFWTSLVFICFNRNLFNNARVKEIC